MRPNAVKVETRGSLFWLDDEAGEYLRLPKHEKPRERPEWSDERAGPLQDAVWHPMNAWRIEPIPTHGPNHCCPHCPGLLIEYGEPGDLEKTLWAPNAEQVTR